MPSRNSSALTVILVLPTLIALCLIYSLYSPTGTYSPSREVGDLAVEYADTKVGFGAEDDYDPEITSYEESQVVELGDDKKVDLDLTVMSRCPDARICEALIDEVMQQPGISDKVALRFNYIGTLDETAKYGVRCMHGDIECRGNIQQLCVQARLPQTYSSVSSDAETMSESSIPALAFIQAQNRISSQLTGKDEYARKALKSVGYSYSGSGVKACVEDTSEGVELLQQSVQRTRDVLDSTKSCTILVQGEKRCVRDGSWYDCEDGHSVEDMTRTIVETYNRLNELV